MFLWMLMMAVLFTGTAILENSDKLGKVLKSVGRCLRPVLSLLAASSSDKPLNH